MGDGWGLLFELLVALSAALVFGVIFEKLKQSAVVGYLLAGILVGPSVAGLVKSGQTITQLAEIGVALLLFTVGLEFSWRRLLKMGRLALVGGTLQVLVTLGIAFVVSLGFRLDWKTGLVIGAAVSLSSTAVILRILSDQSDVDSVHGKATIGVLLTQDVLVVPLVLMVTFLGTGSGEKGVLATLGETAAKATIFAIVLGLTASLLLPRILSIRTMARNRELPILVAISSCIGATWAAHAAGLSPALGAFMAGILLADTRFSEQMRADVLPFKTLFLTLFFASIGMLADAKWIFQNWPQVLTVATLIVVGKSILTFCCIRPFMPSVIGALAASLMLAQVGEFSFVLSRIALENGLIEQELMQLLLSSSILTLLVTPYLVKLGPRWARRIAKYLVPARRLASQEIESHRAAGLKGHVILVGYGDSGQAAARELADADGVQVFVLEIDDRLVGLACEHGHKAQLGDASQASILDHVRIGDACAIIVAVPDINQCRLILSQARAIAPHVPLVARARYALHRDELDMGGATVVIDEETTTGIHLGRAALKLRKGEVLLVGDESTGYDTR